ncbi:MAG: TonB family protein [Candidatus Latescibacteria bacterium]|nr:TonB family protein [Candidatus Latescibacterota bacterium]
MIRGKSPEADLKRSYGHWLVVGLGGSVLLHAAFLALVPAFDFAAWSPPERPRTELILEHMPPTLQTLASPPPPSVELASDRGIVAPQRRVLLVDQQAAALVDDWAVLEEEEAVELWQVEKAPQIAHRVAPAYPDLARQAHLEGRVYVRLLVDSAGKVRHIGAIDGHRAFHQVVRRACRQWRFYPAVQNDQPVSVWVTVPFSFVLE